MTTATISKSGLPWGKLVGASIIFGLASAFNAAIQADTYKKPFGLSENGTYYALSSSHTVRTVDGSGVKYFFNFQNETLTSGLTERAALGGAGYGGMVGFGEANQNIVEKAKAMGCKIATQEIATHRPNILYSLSFNSPFKKHSAAASTFTTNYCRAPQ